MPRGLSKMRKNNLQKTNKQNVYVTKNKDGTSSFIVRFSYKGRPYGEKNFTKKYGCTTANQAFEKLQEAKVDISKGNNPFKKKTPETIDKYFEDYLDTLKDTNNRYITNVYYKKHIKPVIGNKDISKVETSHINTILGGTLFGLSDRSKMTLKVILSPIFEKSIREDKRRHSPLAEIKLKKPKPKKALTLRVVTDLKIVSKILYQNIMNIEDDEKKVVYLIGLMCARRRSEILRLQWDDIRGNKVFIPEEATKTKNAEDYPIPYEVVNILETLGKNTDLVFGIKADRVTRGFTKLVKEADIEYTKGSKMTFHDTRNLFLSIMILDGFNSDLVDACISHSQNNSMKDIYLSFGYDKRKEVFEKYWEILRG